MEKIEFNDDSENEVESKDSDGNPRKELKQKESLPHIKVKNKYSIKDKLKYIKLAEETSIHKVAEKYSIDRKSIREWISQKNIFLSSSDRFKLPSGGRKANLSTEKESKIIDWINLNRELKNCVSIYSIILYIQKIDEEFKDKTYSAQKMIVHRFLKKNGYCLRSPSHIGQPLPNNYNQLFFDFQKKVIISRNMLNIDEFNLQRILNVDETPIYMDMTYNKTIEKKGAKNIEIITTGGEKIRISAILSISGDGKKLPPVLIFKAKPEGKLAKKLNAIEIVKQKKKFLYIVKLTLGVIIEYSKIG